MSRNIPGQQRVISLQAWIEIQRTTLMQIYFVFKLILILNKNKEMKNMVIEEPEADLCSTFAEDLHLNLYQQGQIEFHILNTNNDDLFNFENSYICYQGTKTHRILSQEFQEGLNMLVSGNEQELINGYYSKYRESSKQTQAKIRIDWNEIQTKKSGEAKNIPKNFGKQIIKYVKRNKSLIQRILIQIKSKFKYEELNSQLQKRKRKMGKISDLRDLWTVKSNIGKEMRVISNLFIRKCGFQWIFNSKIRDYGCHIKYRRFLGEALQKPDELKDLKVTE